MSKPETIKIDDVEYVRKDKVQPEVAGDYSIVRTQNAGVFAGYVESRDGDEVRMRNARRLWYWDGAASLSQLAMEGVSKPQNCKFPRHVVVIDLIGVIEIIPATLAARESISKVPVWKS